MVQTRTQKKKLKAESEGVGGNNNRLSNLPEAILITILSLLPTEEAVRTSILSKRWRYRWTSVTNLCFDIDAPSYSGKNRKNAEMTFIKFVDHVLMIGNSSIQDFYLTFSMSDHDLISKWILAATKRNAQKIVINCLSAKSFPTRCLTFNCGFLSELDLLMPCTIKVVSPNLFQSLKILYLRLVTFEPFPDSTELYLNLPVLEIFSVSSCKWMNVNVIHVNAPMLESFSMVDCSFKLEGTEHDGVLKMCTPRLSKLQCGTNPDIMWLSPSAVAALHIEVIVPIYNWNERKTSEQARLLRRQFSGETISLENNALVQGPVPQWLLYNLKIVNFRIFNGDVYQLELAKVLLKNAPVLEKMNINYWNNIDPVVKKVILKCPRRSSRASIVFFKRFVEEEVY